MSQDDTYDPASGDPASGDPASGGRASGEPAAGKPPRGAQVMPFRPRATGSDMAESGTARDAADAGTEGAAPQTGGLPDTHPDTPDAILRAASPARGKVRSRPPASATAAAGLHSWRDQSGRAGEGDGEGPRPGRASDKGAADLDSLLTTAFDAAGELVLIRGCSGRVLYVNAAFLAAFGGARTDWIGRWFSVAPPVSVADSRRYEMLMRTRTGPLWIEWDERLIPEQRGVIAIGRDVTRRREAHDDLEASQRAKSLFFAAVTHELRTPLAGALGLSRLLEATPLRPDQADYIRSIAASADHALAMVDDILDLSRLEAGKLELRPEAVDVADLVRETIELAAPRAQDKGLELVAVQAAGAPSRVTGDAARIRQILFNLIGNAVKFTNEGGVRVDIANAPAADGTPRLAISVTDTGPGISERDQEHLFEHFERGAAERNGAEGGAGLGLAMVRRLAEAMHSSMGVESRLGEGAKFWIVFEVPVLECFTSQPLAGRPVAVASPHALLRSAMADQLDALGADVETIATPERIGDRLAGDLLVDAVWSDRVPPGYAGRTWYLVNPGQKDALLAACARAGEHWFVKPVRVATLVAQMGSQDGAVSSAGRDMHDEGADPPAGPRPAPPPVQPDLSALCVLVAEDDPVNALIARKCLENLGVAVTLVSDGHAASEALEIQAFDAALLDQRMPGCDGPEVARRARAAGLGLPLIALTANASESDRKACMDAGMDEFLTKPLDPDRLLAVLTRLCRTEKRASMR